MKHRVFLMTATLLLTMLSARAQQAQVAQIRKAYAKAKAQIAENGNNGKCIETKTDSDTQDGGKADKDRVRKLVMIFQKITN